MAEQPDAVLFCGDEGAEQREGSDAVGGSPEGGGDAGPVLRGGHGAEEPEWKAERGGHQ